MVKELLTFNNIEIDKKIFWGDADIEKVLVSNKISVGENNYKHFIGYLYNKNRFKPFHIILPKRSKKL